MKSLEASFSKKFKVFLEITAVLNKMNIVPVVYGSLGFYRATGKPGEVGDVDIIVPNKYVAAEFSKLRRAMRKIGWRQDSTFPHEFAKNGVRAGFEPESDLKDLGINARKLKVTNLDGLIFRELKPKDYLLVYRRNLKTHEEKAKKIREKIRLIRKMTR